MVVSRKNRPEITIANIDRTVKFKPLFLLKTSSLLIILLAIKYRIANKLVNPNAVLSDFGPIKSRINNIDIKFSIFIFSIGIQEGLVVKYLVD